MHKLSFTSTLEDSERQMAVCGPDLCTRVENEGSYSTRVYLLVLFFHSVGCKGVGSIGGGTVFA